MALASFYGSPGCLIGPGLLLNKDQTPNTLVNTTIDAANEAVIVIGHVRTADGASHTIDTTGSSSIGWRAGAVTFADAGTTVKVGLAAVDLTAGPPARAVAVANVITLDVSKSMVGGGGGISANAWQTHVPDAGTKTIADGDLVAFCVQMTARGGVADSVVAANCSGNGGSNRPLVTQYTGGTYALSNGLPNAIITFSDGTLGYFQGSEILSSTSVRTFNSGSATKEYGQLYRLPFPTEISGLYAWVDPDANFDIVLYSDPLGTPVPERTISIDANAVGAATGRRIEVGFAPYTTVADQRIGVVIKPGASNVSAYYRTLADATHRVADVWGVEGYGISRASGAFADANVGLDHYYAGLVISGFEVGGGGVVSPLFGGGII